MAVVEKNRPPPTDLNGHDDGDGTVLVRVSNQAKQPDQHGVRDSKIHIPAAHIPAPHVHAPIETAAIEAAPAIHWHIEATTTRIH